MEENVGSVSRFDEAETFVGLLFDCASWHKNGEKKIGGGVQTLLFQEGFPPPYERG